MNKQNTIKSTNKSKAIVINILFIISLMIIFLGLFFSFFSLVNHINFKILNTSVPGIVFGLLVLYLGIRYYLSVGKLKDELYKSSSKFSWSNFKIKKLEKLFYKK